MEKVYLLLGTNLGNLEENLSRALEQLRQNHINILKSSKIYKTKPWGNINQPDFLNMAVEIECNCDPRHLLQLLKEIETKVGRTPGPPLGPRIIDIDILFYGQRIINEEGLIIPHPQFFNRAFAIIPLAEISPDYTPPSSSRSIKDLVAGLKNEGIEVYCN